MDTQKLRQSLNKKDISTDLSDPDCWLSTGNMALNYILSNNFNEGIPNRRSTLLFGPSGTGKSLLLGNIAKNAQDKGYMVVYIDSEGAIDTKYLTRIGLSLAETDFLPVRVSTVEDTASVISDLMRTVSPADKVFVALDSLSMLEPAQELEKFQDKGELQNDQGRTAKKFKSLVKNVNAKIGNRDMFFVYTAHAYANQDIMNGKGKWLISGGEGQLYIPSMSLLLDKLKLKEGTENIGFQMKAEIYKSRFSMLGAKSTLKIPYDAGIDLYDGLLPIFEKLGMVSKNGAWYNYIVDGKTIKFQSLALHEHADAILNQISSSEADDPTAVADDDVV